MRSLVLDNYMLSKLQASLRGIFTNNMVNMPTGTNWLFPLVNIGFKMYDLWKPNITPPLRLVFLCLTSSILKCQEKKERREKKKYVLLKAICPTTTFSLEIIHLVVSLRSKEIRMPRVLFWIHLWLWAILMRLF